MGGWSYLRFFVYYLLGLTAPPFMYFLLRKLVTKEEIYLENVFGSEYLDYKNRVPCIIPIGFLKQSYPVNSNIG
jgi:protein-S-isoprenylcysteine O-methyltransferase Ste14